MPHKLWKSSRGSAHAAKLERCRLSLSSSILCEKVETVLTARVEEIESSSQQAVGRRLHQRGVTNETTRVPGICSGSHWSAGGVAFVRSCPIERGTNA
jgi:hypothetical protein